MRVYESSSTREDEARCSGSSMGVSMHGRGYAWACMGGCAHVSVEFLEQSPLVGKVLLTQRHVGVQPPLGLAGCMDPPTHPTLLDGLDVT